QPAPALPGGRIGPPVVANLPSSLQFFAGFRRSRLAELAALPPACGDGVFNQLYGPPFAIGGPLGDGRLLGIADHSLFINNMILQPDTGNIDFAYRCAEWLLQRPDGGRRGQILYVEDGQVRTDFEIPLKSLPPPPLPSPEALLPLVNETLIGLEKEN